MSIQITESFYSQEGNRTQKISSIEVPNKNFFSYQVQQKASAILEPELNFPNFNNQQNFSVDEIWDDLVSKKAKHEENVRNWIPSTDPYTGYRVFSINRGKPAKNLEEALDMCWAALNAMDVLGKKK